MRLRILVLLPFLGLIGATSAVAAVLPLGDGRVGSQPAAGSVYACPLPAVPGGPGGAASSVPWITGSTWNTAAKPRVQGPTLAATADCLPFGPIGVTANGVYLFDALDGLKRDAVAHEVQDAWKGAQTRIYHYDATAEYPYTLGCFRGTPGTIG